MKKLILFLFLTVFSLFSLSSCATPDPLTVDILKIGQADAIILKTPSHAVLIDTGEDDDGAEISQKLSNLGIKTIDLLIITHYDKDHIGGAPQVLKNIEVKEIIEPGYEKDDKRYTAFRAAAKEIPCTILTETVSYQFDSLSLTVSPPPRDYENENDASLMTMVKCCGKKLLFTGDIMAERIDDLLAENSDLSADFLKVPHHGKLEENSADFLKAVSPEISAVTCSDKNPADPALLKLLSAYGTIYETRDGDIRLVVTENGELLAGQ